MCQKNDGTRPGIPLINRLLSKLEFECCYSHKGCREIVLYDSLHKHESTCLHRSIKLPANVKRSNSNGRDPEEVRFGTNRIKELQEKVNQLDSEKLNLSIKNRRLVKELEDLRVSKESFVKKVIEVDSANFNQFMSIKKLNKENESLKKRLESCNNNPSNEQKSNPESPEKEREVVNKGIVIKESQNRNKINDYGDQDPLHRDNVTEKKLELMIRPQGENENVFQKSPKVNLRFRKAETVKNKNSPDKLEASLNPNIHIMPQKEQADMTNQSDTNQKPAMFFGRNEEIEENKGLVINQHSGGYMGHNEYVDNDKVPSVMHKAQKLGGFVVQQGYVGGIIGDGMNQDEVLQNNSPREMMHRFQVKSIPNMDKKVWE